MAKSLTVVFCFEGDSLEAECAKDVEDYGLEGYKIIQRHSSSGAWPEVEFTGPEDKIDEYERVYNDV